MGELAIVAEGLVKQFGAVEALSGVDLQVPTGSILGLLGPNGAGKTTAVRVLATLLRPDAGRARVAGLDVVRQAAAVRRRIGLAGQYAAVDPYLTGRENLQMIGRLSGLTRASARRRADELLDTFDLGAAADRVLRSYSGGMRRRLDVAASLVARPSVLFLDEPTTGLDPRGRIGLWHTIAALTAQGTTVLLTTQYMEEADHLADTIAVIDTGRVIATGTSNELKAQVGGDRLELRAAPGVEPAALAATVADLGSGPPAVDCGEGTVVLPVADGPGVLGDAVARLAAAELRVTDVALRRPSLDDVFLALTGQSATAGPATDLAETRSL
ncbi:daunorubicin resistance ABC transporter ATP-binding subunit [Kribbella aluminosa]|uniref:Daunorubicin resistance ABC transporter ATP-binding subunit n=1 Tax=Kribbella aluminosa TaxID=416017 RepID=A0ABS4UBA3_9ACTN|nr:ATP-binding cassette domain-containing protein [Kribbella aluminosa]MBP2348932.1 daunorubicin resistance ABC transporter ATP-binding subunit [Kribbella aluminosa]MBP2357577.1 daunorubicin resistance ABC transporter ATP-binding subunit [Kribbella aluminosa]